MTDRLRTSFERLIFALLPTLANYAQWKYRVTSVSAGPPVSISGAPVSDSCPHGTLANITLWPGPDGGYAVPIVGSFVLVRFNDGNPNDPAVCGLDPLQYPTTITLGAPAATFIAPAPWAIALATSLETFLSGLNTTTLAGQAATFLTALTNPTFPPSATTVTRAQ